MGDAAKSARAEYLNRCAVSFVKLDGACGLGKR